MRPPLRLVRTKLTDRMHVLPAAGPSVAFVMALRLRAISGTVLRATAGIVLAGAAVAQAQTAPPLKVIEIRGADPGPTVAFVAGVHGGKASASVALERLAARLQRESARMRGRVRIVPVANEAGRKAGLAQLAPDSLNLNRVFPGKRTGQPTERLAARIMYEVVAGADYLIDMHGSDGDEMVGRFAYAARPGVRPSVDSAALRLARLWGTPLVVWDTEGPRTVATSTYLQTAAHLSNVPAITVFEAGAEREEERAIEAFLAGALRVLGALDVLTYEVIPVSEPSVRPARAIVVAPVDGRWEPTTDTRPGRTASGAEPLGTFVDSSAVTDRAEDLRLDADARGVLLHVRKAGAVRAGTPLVIIAVDP